MTSAADIREARAAMRSAYTLLRAEVSPEYGNLIEALERSHENLIEALVAGLNALDMAEVRLQVLTRAAALMPKSDTVPLRLVRDVFDGETVA